MNNIKQYIFEKLKINKDSKDDKDIVLKDFIIHYLDKNNSLKYEKDYNINFRSDEKNGKYIDIKFLNFNYDDLKKINKIDLCKQIEKELSYDYYWSLDWKTKTISLSDSFI